MLACRPFEPDESPLVTEARQRGYVGTATLGTRYGFVGVAVPLRSRGVDGSIALVTGAGLGPLSDEDERELADVARAAAEEIGNSGL
jgi:DNA-binding IclR family transcriptional regulator